MTQSTYSKLKIQNLDLDEITHNSPITDPSIPKFMKINISQVYANTGLPKPAMRAKDDEKEIFMIQNLFRVYKRLLI
jgi:hypothetical protein